MTHHMGSGVGAGDVNAMIENKYALNTEVQNEIYNKLSAKNDLN